MKDDKERKMKQESLGEGEIKEKQNERKEQGK